MRVVIAPDKFKGSLSAAEASEQLAAGMREIVANLDIALVPMADGGEGTVDAALAGGYEGREAVVSGPLGEPVIATFAVRGDEAVIEMARASGLGLVSPERRDALRASSRGTGELILAALDAGAKFVMLAIGGSASSDGGAGMLSALGVRVRDAAGTVLEDGGGSLRNAASVDLSGLDPRLAGARVVIASDVDNVLLGPNGAAAVFSRQKGADDVQIAQLELGLTAFARALETATGGGFARMIGAGAAGGVGFAAFAALKAERWPGVEVVAAITSLRAHLAGAHLVITGEGSLDQQSIGGKTPVGVAAIAAKLDVPAVVVCGKTSLSEAEWRAVGFSDCYAVVDRAFSEATSVRDAARLLRGIGKEIAETHLVLS